MNRLFFFVTLFLYFLFPFSFVHSSQDFFQDPNDFKAHLQNLEMQSRNLKNTIPNSYFKAEKNRNHSRKKLSPSQIKSLKEFKVIELERELRVFQWNLYQDLLALQHDAQSSLEELDWQALQNEALHLAQVLIVEIERLKAVYHSSFSPTLHNAFIHMGLKDRGACKHWAEDLIKVLKDIPRRFYAVTWGEANATKLNEHNVAVLYPKSKAFDQGLIIDPWRTSGVPFWLPVKKDKKYKWQQWDQHPVY